MLTGLLSTMSLDLKHRSKESEWLDGADLNPAELENVLRDLATFNQTFLGHYPLLRWLDKAIAAQKDARLTLVDVGCGYSMSVAQEQCVISQ